MIRRGYGRIVNVTSGYGSFSEGSAVEPCGWATQWSSSTERGSEAEATARRPGPPFRRSSTRLEAALPRCVRRIGATYLCGVDSNSRSTRLQTGAAQYVLGYALHTLVGDARLREPP
jgi:hypothetical protein